MDSKKGMLLVLATALISGVSVFLNKFALSTIEPTLFTFLKNATVGVLLLGVLVLFHERKTILSLSKMQWAKLLTIGLIGGAIPFVLFFQGLSIASASSGAFVHKTLFLFATLGAFVLLKEKINIPILLGAGLLLAGNFLLLKMQSIVFGEGELLILVAVLFWAVENVLAKNVLRELSGTVVGAARMGFGALFILPYLLLVKGSDGLFSLSPDAWLWVAFTSGLLFVYVFTYYNGLKHVSVSTATSVLMIGSPITSILSMVFSSATLSLSQIGGIVLLLAGIGIVIAWSENNPFSAGLWARWRSRNG